MINHELVKRVFRKTLVDVEGMPTRNNGQKEDYAIAVENRPFTPPAPTPDNPKPMWVRETYIPGRDVLAGSDTLQAVCILQYDVMCPSGTGTEDAEKLAQAIGAKFPAATSLQDDEESVQIAVTEASVLLGRDAGTIGSTAQVWWMKPVQITFRVFARNLGG